ncbi:MAG: transcription elongation factor GreA [Anaerolinea sp.]|nr:transcription elongation factor GreA [Anaerolinea sp.]
MSEKTVPLTREGKAKLEEELEDLRAQRRVVAERIHNAQEQGTSQNDAEYDDAKLEQGMLEGRILELEDVLRRATVIDEAGAHKAGRVMVGSGIQVEQDGKKRHYQIVGAPEADPVNGKISNESPVGSALLGRAVGETVEVNVPKGVIKVKVLKID